ncbi:MAG: glycine cleavage system aminomethyltransferase GcvT [Corynebacterium sp.]|uniref:glycine cleavage system aminomethyltransferase GcvT n=1 Tax=Corynebacterium sp. TaxID=1720 RepID=UPI0026DD03A3|nr:glycine cleavage system aminomethyltransferase GcvT [Corynebacterium sp.]MDO5097867.1 glycine cleavage system aminomethyltransferase GcvT [Corynebacterium sp.]
MTDLRQSPLHAEHDKLGATFIPFGPWNMPLKYGNELAEHRAVRGTCGIFDLSHMGEVWVSGPDAGAFLDYALISRLSTIKVGKAKYTMIVAASGGIIDDLIVYRTAEDTFLVVPNAGNADVVVKELRDRAAGFDVVLNDASATTALIAVQGPNAQALILELAANPQAVTELGYYAAVPAVIADHDVLLARTGYTGEDGFELFIPAEEATDLWQKIIAAGDAHELVPCGLAARDSLRLEAGMPLYGNELTLETTPLHAGLGVLVAKEGDFIGKDALAEVSPERVLVGLTSSGRRAARSHAALFDADGTAVGEVTSGLPSPTLGHPIALAYVDVAHSEIGTALEAEISGKRYPFEVVALPFYSRKRA